MLWSFPEASEILRASVRMESSSRAMMTDDEFRNERNNGTMKLVKRMWCGTVSVGAAVDFVVKLIIH